MRLRPSPPASPGQGFSFDGTADRVELPASAFPTPGVNEAFSFETWFRCEDAGVILGQTSTLTNDTPIAGYVPLIYVAAT